MSDQRFPSGPWTGYFTYRDVPGKHRTDMALGFSNARITGEGADGVGVFVIDGHYDTTSGECSWTKSYVSRHDVHYRGFAEGKGIWGTWEIEDGWRGGFQIWPLGDELANRWQEEAEEPQVDVTAAPRAKQS